MRLNSSVRQDPVYTHQGARASIITPEQKLLRLTSACLLWEDTFYVDGKTIAEQIEENAAKVSEDTLIQLARTLKFKNRLRHIPLLIAVLLIKVHRSKKVSKLIYDLVTRPDDMCELLKIYWKDGRCPLANQLKKGLASAFSKFDHYQLAKWNLDSEIVLRDVLFLVHPRAKTISQQKLWDHLAKKTLSGADTWENRLKKGDSKEKTFKVLMAEEKLGFQACLMNLRNMRESGISTREIGDYMVRKASSAKVLPFQFISAFNACPDMIDYLEPAFMLAFRPEFKLKKRTAIMLDVSGSMSWGNLSGKSSLNLLDAACGLAMFAREICEEYVFYTFSESLHKIEPFRGFALRNAIINSQPHSGTYLAHSLRTLRKYDHDIDRLVIITDEQTQDGVLEKFVPLSYIVNIGNYQHGVGYGSYSHINGFSPNVFDYIHSLESI